MQAVSPGAQAVYNYIKESIESGISPTVREICAELGYRSTSTAHKYISELIEAGYIDKRGNQKRTLTLTASAGGEVSAVPIVGDCAAGVPILAVENITGYIPYKKTYKGDSLFAVNIKGHSMRDLGILDGDVVVLRQTSDVLDGDVVLALIEGEATLKSFYREEGGCRLVPHNPDFETIHLREVTILGKALSVIRDL